MPQIVFIPALVCLYVVVTYGTRRAFLDVVLPVLLLLPANFVFEAPHLRPLSFTDVTFLVLGFGMLAMDTRRWKFSRTDLWIGVWAFSAAYCQLRVWGWNGVALHFSFGLMGCIFPYMAGKLLMEAEIRIAALQRFVTLLAVAGSIGVIEYFFRRNPYMMVFSHFFPGQWAFGTQIRWHFGRLAGPYTQSEFAGMIFLTGLILTLWLRSARYKGLEDVAIAPLPRKQTNLILALLSVILFMTQARGPWIGTLIALPVAFLGRVKKPGRAALLLVTVALFVGVPAYLAGKSYIAGPRTNYGSERETAQYRAELIDNYVPIAERGGAWGWGYPFPMKDGQNSIDNEYLFSWVVQGTVGVCAFLLIGAESFITLVTLAVKTKSANDRALAYALIGIFAGLTFVLSTVYLGAQSYQVFFLLVGWSQAIRISKRPDEGTPKSTSLKSAIRVYT